MFACYVFYLFLRCASLSSQSVSLALYVLFDLFLLISGSGAWWSVINSIGRPYIWRLKCSSPHTTTRSSSSFIGYFFSASDKNLLAEPNGFTLLSLPQCFSQTFCTGVFLLKYFHYLRGRVPDMIFVMYSFNLLNIWYVLSNSIRFVSSEAFSGCQY